MEPTLQEAIARLRNAGPTTTLRVMRDPLLVVISAAESAAADRERVEKAEKDAKRFRTLEPWQVELDGYTGDQFVWVDDDTRVAGCDIADLADALAAAPDAGQD